MINPCKVEISAMQVDKVLPSVISEFPFLKDWNRCWYMMNSCLVFYKHPLEGNMYSIIHKFKTNTLELRLAKEVEGGYLEAIGDPIKIWKVNSACI